MSIRHRIKWRFITLAKLMMLLLCGFVSIASGQAFAKESTTKTDFQDKHYRQALYYYFQGDQNQALSQIEQSKARLGALDSRSSLFEAGLQLSAGLLQQAKVTLVNFEAQFAKEKALEKSTSKPSSAQASKANKLTLISLLSLTDQYLQQGDFEQARDTLKRLKSVSATYYPQYHVLSQLAYWPEQVNLLPISASEQVSTPYIQLNNALRLIELAEYEQAIEALKIIKMTTWHKQQDDFWRTLFINEASFTSQNEADKMTVLQGQAIKDYAQLLLAQIYISQQQYPLAFAELKTFPEQSPYTESALFLFAFASQQVQQYSIAFNLLNLHYTTYPHSPLGWQSAELMAQQVSEQQSLAQGVSAYQQVEQFFVQRQKSLTNFANDFDQSKDLLTFSVMTNKTSNKNASMQLAKQNYLPQSVWLQQVLLDAEVKGLYQQLLSIDQQTAHIHLLLDKTQWLTDIIELNQQRKNNIIKQQQARNHSALIQQLIVERDHLSMLLNEQTEQALHNEFADKTQAKWLDRIKRSQAVIKVIGSQKNTTDYQARLARAQGVLSWQLMQQYPERAWQHKKLLHQVNHFIDSLALQHKQLLAVAKTDNNLTQSITKHQNSVVKLTGLLATAADLRRQVSQKIRAKVHTYIDEQSLLLAEHLLSTRQSMANVLEQMATEDKRRLLQVNATQLPHQDSLTGADITDVGNTALEAK